MSASTDTLLDFSLAPRRYETVRFDLLDEDLNKIGQVYPLGAPSLTIDRSRQVKRSLEGITLMTPDSERLTFRTRLAPVWVFDDGSTYNLGVFVLSDETVGPDDQGRLDAVAMGDQMSLYRESLQKSFVVRPGDSILDKLVEAHQLASNPAPYVGYTHNTAIATQTMVWTASTPIIDVLEELADAAAMQAWFTVDGQLRFDIVDQEKEPIDLAHHIEGSLKYSYSNEDAHNRWVVRDNSLDFSTVGTYELPASAPHSFAKRGRYVTQEVEVPGLVGQDAANALALEEALNEEFPYKEASLELPARPDLDVFDSVRLNNGQVFRIDSVTTDLVPSGTSQVDCQAMWENPDTALLETKSTFDGGEPISGDVPPTRGFMLWSPNFRKMWSTLTPQQQRSLRRYFEAIEQQRAERQERRRRRAAQRRRKGRRRQHRPPTRRRGGRVTSTDAHLRTATVILDGDPDGTEVPVRMESDIPGNEQRVMVQFNSPTPVAVGTEGGIQRCLGYVRIVANSTQSTLAENEVNGCEVEVTITQPGRLIVIMAQCRIGIATGNPLMFIEAMVQRDDGEGNYARIGYIGSQLGVSDLATGETLSGYVVDASPDPGVYSYRLATQGSDQPYRVMGAMATTKLTVFDFGADPEAV